MKIFKAILCDEHKEILVVDEDCEEKAPYNFLIKHRLCKLEIINWCSSLDNEDNGFPNNIYNVIN